MKKEFSTKWKGSSQPRKQRKYLANAPLHLKKKTLSVNLSKDLRSKHSTRNVLIKKGDTVKIMRGKFSKKQGKVLKVDLKKSKIYVEGMNTTKMDGSKVNVSLRSSNLQIIALNLDDKKRAQKLKTEVAKEKKETKKNPEKEQKKETPKKEKSTDKEGENKK